MRPTTGPIRRDKPSGLASSGLLNFSQSKIVFCNCFNMVIGRHKRKPPRGMYLDHEDLLTFCGEPEMQSESVLKGMDSEIVALKRLVKKKK